MTIKKEKKKEEPKKSIEALILEGAELSAQIKSLEKKLDTVKKELKERKVESAGNHIGYDNSVLKITSKSTWINPEPKELFDKLKEQRKSSLFWKCVIVQTKLAVEALGEETFKSFQTEGKPQLAYSFSK